ncbi:MAG: radical SAM protein, partial [Candidatus Coatesbacteria bacterium]|nr:radical SAM protein [Candidatus Coatesbacteria bacterium]
MALLHGSSSWLFFMALQVLFLGYKPALRQRILEKFNDHLRKRLLKKRYFIPWEVSWFPTYKCNLKCFYCNSNPLPMLWEDAERGARKIIELKPASLSILGGEPFIVPKISDYIEQIVKALPNIFIMLTTNGMVKQEHVEKAARYLYSFCFSMDGLGDYQT